VVTSLIDLLFVYLLRAWLAEQDHAVGGWAGALYDPAAVGGALAMVHADPARPWTVTNLARAVGVPRATFSRRFTTMTGQSPTAYVTMWRMTVAARLLHEGRAPLREVAPRVGYDSEFAFARTFKRVVGCAPAATGPRPSPNIDSERPSTTVGSTRQKAAATIATMGTMPENRVVPIFRTVPRASCARRRTRWSPNTTRSWMPCCTANPSTSTSPSRIFSSPTSTTALTARRWGI
jgi:AraC-like DNA-binding protein